MRLVSGVVTGSRKDWPDSLSQVRSDTAKWMSRSFISFNIRSWFIMWVFSQSVRVISTVVSVSIWSMMSEDVMVLNVDSMVPWLNLSWLAMEFVIKSFNVATGSLWLDSQVSSTRMVTRTSVLLGRSDLAQTWAANSTRESPAVDLISVATLT